MTEPVSGRPFYPASLDVSGRPCLVVGGGPVAARKARALLECGAAVTVVAPTLSSEMEALAAGLSEVVRRPYRKGEAVAYRLVVSATGLPDVDGAVFADADSAGIWVNSADDPAHCSFILPAVYRDGAVTVSVSTSGLSPALASWLRDRLAASCGPGLGDLTALLAEARSRLRSEGTRSNAVDWRALLDGPLPELVRSGDFDNARATIQRATTTSEQL